jgi:hypothetical protein
MSSFFAGTRITEPNGTGNNFFERLENTGVYRMSDTPKPKVLDIHSELLLEILKKLSQVIPDEDYEEDYYEGDDIDVEYPVS